MIRVGLLGAGFMAEAHARGYAALPGRARLTAVYSRGYERAQELAERHGAQAAHDLEDLLEQVDAVSVCTPTPTHTEFALAALQAGKHVLCEKPLARTHADALRMAQAARAAGVKLMAAHVCRYEVDHRQAREVLRRGDLGALRLATYSATGPPPDWARDGWFADPAQSGGPLLDLALHGFDYLLWLFEAPAQRVYAAGRAPNYALAHLRFANGGLGIVEASWAHPPGPGLTLRAELVGTQGRLDWDYESIASLHVTRGAEARQAQLMVGEDSFLAEVEDFVRCIEQDSEPPIPGEAGAEAVRVALAAVASFETGEAVEL